MKSLTKILIFIGLILAVAFSGCLDGNGDNNNTVVSKTKNVSISDNNTAVRFEFETNASTGYNLTVTANQSGILNQTTNNSTSRNNTSGTQTFTYRAQSPGTVSLNFRYTNTSDNTTTTVENLTYVIRVDRVAANNTTNKTTNNTGNLTVSILSVSSPRGDLLPLSKNTTFVNNNTAIRFTFEETPSTGYIWNETITPSGVLNKTADNHNVSVANITGAPNSHVWDFEGLRAGNATVTFDCRRSFENNSTLEQAVYRLRVNSDDTISILGVNFTVNQT